MKGAIPALLLALEKGLNNDLKYDVSVMITTDEEYSQASQLRYISRFLQPLKGAYFFDLDSNFGHVSIASLGALQMDILVKGRSVHSGLSHLGENAVEKAALILEALLNSKPRVVSRKSRILTHPETGLDRMTARLNINMIQGGLKVNIVPDQCTISIDRRLIPEENLTEARKEIMDTLAAVPDVNWEIVKEFSIPTLPPSNDPIIDKLADDFKRSHWRKRKIRRNGLRRSGQYRSQRMELLWNSVWGLSVPKATFMALTNLYI